MLLNFCQAVPRYPAAEALQAEVARLAADPEAHETLGLHVGEEFAELAFAITHGGREHGELGAFGQRQHRIVDAQDKRVARQGDSEQHRHLRSDQDQGGPGRVADEHRR